MAAPAEASTFTPSSDEPPLILTEAGLSGVMVFDGNGDIAGDSSVNIVLAGVTCPASDYQTANGGSTSATYVVVSKGLSTFAASFSHLCSAIAALKREWMRLYSRFVAVNVKAFRNRRHRLDKRGAKADATPAR